MASDAVARYPPGMRTTIDIDGPILKDLKRLQREEGKSLARVLNELLATALKSRRGKARSTHKLRLPSRAMQQRIDVEDREAVWNLLTEEESRR